MHYLDELLSIYPEASRSKKKFVLGSLLDAAPDRYGDECARLLWSEVGQRDPIVRREARYVLGRFLPRHTARSYGIPLSPGSRDLVSTHVELDTQARGSEECDLIQVGGFLLENVLRETHKLARGGAPMVRDAASLVLGRLWTHRTVKVLADRILSHKRISFGSAFALAEIGHRQARDALVRAARTAGPEDPDIYMLLRSVPTDESLVVLTEHEEKASRYGRTNIAHALASFSPAHARPLVERIVSRKDDWSTAFALHSIAVWADPSYFELARRLYEGSPTRFIQVQTVRAIASMRGGEVLDFCRERLQDADPNVQSAALEGLIRNSRDLSALQGDIVPLARSDSARLRIRRMLLLAQVEPGELEGMLATLLGSESTLERRAVAYALGFLGGLGVEDLLANMAFNDPAFAVRCQAIRSLGTLDTTRAVELLVDLVARSRDVDDVQESIRILATPGASHCAEALDALLALQALATGTAGRALLMRGVGLLSALLGRRPPDALSAALDHPEPAVVAGALEGLRRIGDHVPVDAIRKLSTHADAKVRTRAAGALLASGDFDAGELFVRMLTSGNEAIQLSALSMLLDIACLVPLAVRSDRFAGLSSTLRNQRGSPEFCDFQNGALPVTQIQIDLLELQRAAGIEDLVEHSIRVNCPRNVLIPDIKQLVHVYDRTLGPGAKFKVPPAARGSWVAALREALVWPRGLIVFLPFVVLGFFVFRAFQTPAPADVGIVYGPSGLERGTFSVLEVNGVATRTGQREQPRLLRVGSTVKAGDLLDTNSRGTATLADSLGNSIRLGLSSKLAFAAAEPTSWSPTEIRYSFDGVAGDVTFDFRRTTETKVRLGSSVFTLGRGAVRIADDPPGRKLTQQSGEGALIEANGQIVRLSPGKSATLLDTPQ